MSCHIFSVLHLQLLLPFALATPSLDAGAGNVRLSPLSMAEEQQALPTVPMASQAGPMAAAILDENGQLVAPSAALVVLRTRLVRLIGALQEVSEIVLGLHDQVFVLEQELDGYLEEKERWLPDGQGQQGEARERVRRQLQRAREHAAANGVDGGDDDDDDDGGAPPAAQRRRVGQYLMQGRAGQIQGRAAPGE